MAAWVTLITICAVAIPFYLRFVVALYREYRRERRAPSERSEVGKSVAPMIESRHKDDRRIELHG
jgi:NADH:ubiquinone oxidoreductase subunit 2 (subunit N)